MERNKTVSDDQLRKTFKEMPVENLSPAFMERMKQEIEKAELDRRKEKIWVLPVQILAGVASMLLLLLLSIHLCNLFIPGFHLSFSDINISIDSNYIVIGLAVLMLLIIDELHGKRLRAKKLKGG